jgi:cytochrome c-type biogenesis protein CcmH
MRLRDLSRIVFLLLAAAVLWRAAPAHAVEPDEILPDAQLEARARAISSELRCLVCQNQSIDDSTAPLARDLRLLVRERLNAGDADDDVMRFIVARYGEFVLLRPRFGGANMILWLAPALILLTGLLVLMRRLARPRPAAPRPLTPEEDAKLGALLGPPDDR